MDDQASVAGPRTCRRCGVLSPASATACECGLVFDAPGTIEPAAGPRGLGGWLVLLAIGLIVQPLRLLGVLGQDLRAFTGDTWRSLTTPESPAYHPAWGPVLLTETVVNTAFLGGSFVLLNLFFNKRVSFPRLAIVFLLASAFFQLTQVIVGRLLLGSAVAQAGLDSLAISAVSATIWTTYLLRSRRVAATFVN